MESLSELAQLTERERKIIDLVAEGLSNREIAERLFFSLETVKWYLKQIYSKLGVHSRTQAILRSKELGMAEPATHTAPLPLSRPGLKHNLPTQFTRFVGRQNSLEKLSHLLNETDARLVSIIGPGGIGKTRLALEFATRQIEAFTDGVYFVPLAPLQSTSHLVSHIADAIDLQLDSRAESQLQLLNYLRHKHLLLVLDNFEHLLDGADIVSEMLGSASKINILVTSREILNLTGESVFTLTGLNYPEREEMPDKIAGYNAVLFFIQCVQRLRPDFIATDEDMKQIARICCLAEGMPLAMLLAASWIETLSLSEIAQEMCVNLDFLESNLRDLPARQRSIRAVFEASWNRLAEDEKVAFARFSVFRDSFTRAAAQTITGASLRTLSNLVAKTLLQRDSQTGRYSVHELLRQYAEEWLRASGTTDAMYSAHMDYYLRFLQEREADLKGRRQLESLAEIEADIENVLAAWDWAVQCGDVDQIDQSLESFHNFFMIRDTPRIGMEIMGQALERLYPVSGDNPPPTWGRLAARWAYYKVAYGSTEVKPLVETSLALAHQQGSQADIAFSLVVLGTTLMNLKDYDNTIAAYQESFRHFCDVNERTYMVRLIGQHLWWSSFGFWQHDLVLLYTHHFMPDEADPGDILGVWLSLQIRANVEYDAGRYDLAENLLYASLPLAQQLRHKQALAQHLALLSRIDLMVRGNFADARKKAEEAYKIYNSSQFPHEKTDSLRVLTAIAIFEEDYVRAQQNIDEIFLINPIPNQTPFIEMLLSCGIGDFVRARKAARIHLKGHIGSHAVGLLTWALVAFVIIIAHEGQSLRAVELLGLVFNHPQSANAWMYKWPLLTRLRENLEAELGKKVYAAAWERGKTLDVDAVARELLAAAN